ncbi:MAG TPA: carboxypeptidase-like regulatory domain-containing protein, partial [Terriglobia bacterium]|nr:carboxypeptidase-like regulatory domain-containing protein [Terriglobia bacterium]
MKLFPIVLLITLTGTYLLPQAAPQTPRLTGIVQGTVTRENSVEPIPDVQITVDVAGGPGAVTITGPTGELITITPQNGQQLLDAVARGGARGLPQEYLDAAQQAVRGNPTGAASAPPPPLTATSDAAGHFTISGVPAGKITVRAQLQGYFGSPVNGNYPAMVTANATVSADKPADVRLSMIPGTISGRVFDAAGKPLSDTPVQALRRGFLNGTSTLNIVNLKSSDDHGDYRMYRLPPGEYFMAATPQRIPNAFANGASTATEVPASTLYPGVLDTATAVPIVLRGGDEITGINIPIKMAATSTISGKVILTVPTEQVNYGAMQRGNVPAAVPTVTLARRDGFGLDIGGGGNSVFKPEDGTFEFRNVQAGSYVVIARVPVTANNGWGPQNVPARATGPVAFGRTPVVVRGVDVKEVAVVVHKGVDLNGRLFVDGKAA